ncbi:hypothetical protein OGAPHI_000924 [Ogataea philodendri]|uniref:C2 NT-type domain-containing protein n=1 Tax=Ogataea philodendri TaxID=1378263 RepID=A0A9P8PFR5_9ASCO|nr:uncharacterized protein OGAPHI_000924 [Ogataea philodendri]KAH3670409.1 hypothetical protein OGAPHI_000924 [Ogataea philodendri]
MKLNYKSIEFELSVRLEELTNIPQLDHVSVMYVHQVSNSRLKPKQQLHHRHSAQSGVFGIQHHKCVFKDEAIVTRLKLYADPKDGFTLSDKWLYITFFIEDSRSTKKERLGTLELNLTEYANDREPIQLRYLLKNSKANAILKLEVYMKHLDSAQDYHYNIPKRSTQQIYTGLKDSIETSKQELPKPQASQDDPDVVLDDIINKTYRFSWQFNGMNYDEFTPMECVRDIVEHHGNGWRRNEYGVPYIDTIHENCTLPTAKKSDYPVQEADYRSDLKSWHLAT